MKSVTHTFACWRSLKDTCFSKQFGEGDSERHFFHFDGYVGSAKLEKGKTSVPSCIGNTLKQIHYCFICIVFLIGGP